MSVTVAIQPDDHTNPAIGKPDASSPRWAEAIRAAGHQVRWVNVFADNIFEQLVGCDAFMWRHIHTLRDHAVAKRLLPTVREQLGMPTYPDYPTDWHYDDKIAQKMLLEAAGVPTPKTWVFWDRGEAESFLRSATYPLVLKLAAGAGSKNVTLLRNRDEAMRWIVQLFESGVESLDTLPAFGLAGMANRFRDAARYWATGEAPNPGSAYERHRSYALLQQFLPGNDFDTRVSVIGNRAFAYRRFNRPGDFRASGSGNFDTDPNAIDIDAVCLAFDTARRLGTQSIAIDGLKDGSRWVVGEVSYTFVSWMVHACPGHWELQGGEPVWRDGQIYPEDAQVADFISRLEHQATRRTAA